MNRAERIKAQQEIPDIEVKEFSGLSLKADIPNQPNSVWQTLDNFDLYVPGSIRKVLPPVKYNLAPFPPGVKILNFINYYAQPNAKTGATLRILGIGTDGNIYNVRTGAVWASLVGIVGPFVAAMPSMDTLPQYFVPFNVTTWLKGGTFAINDAVLKYDADSGDLFVFAVTAITTGVAGANEPTWEEGISITDGGVTWQSVGIPNSQRFLENALIVTVPGFRPIICVEWQYDPNNGAELPHVFVNTGGIAPPQIPAQLGVVTILSSLSGYTPIAGRAYSYTWYDSGTLHESSPAPIAVKTKITETDASNMTATIVGSLLQPLPADVTGKQFQSYQTYYVAISASAAAAALASGYKQLFIYATKDGGASFFRVTQLFDDLGNLVTNSDGSISITKAIAMGIAKGWTDYFPLPTPQAMQNSLRFYEGSGPANLSPDPTSLGPSSWTVKNGNAMVVVPGDSPQGNAAIEYNGTGASGNKNIYQSNKIPVHNGTNYFFSGYIDDTAGSGGGTVRWEVVAGDGTHYLDLSKADGTAGTVSGTFLKPADGNTFVRIRAHVEAETVAVGSQILFGDPLFIVGTAASVVPINYPTTDPTLITPAPAALSQNQAPISLLGAIFQGAYFTVEQGTFRIWFSNVGDVQSVGANSFLPLDSSAGAPVLELVAGYDRLVVGKQRTIGQVTGTDQTNFRPNTIDPQHGVLAVRSSIGIGPELMSLLSVGITLLRLTPRVAQSANEDSVSIGYGPEKIVGDIIKPLTDQIFFGTKNILADGIPCPAVDNTQNIYLFAFCIRPQSISGGVMLRVTQNSTEILRKS